MSNLLIRIFIMFILLINAPLTCLGEMLSEDDKEMLENQLVKTGAFGFTIDINVRVKIPKERNPHLDEDITLWATVIRPNISYREKTPTVLMATPYNRLFLTPTVAPIITFGYTLMVVDIKGSGSSEGTWEVFDLAEQYATKFVVDEFIPKQEWSDGNVGMIGPSYMGITQMLVAGIVDCDEEGAPLHLKALFPLVPFADLYKEGLMQGGTLNIPLEAGIFGIVKIFGMLPTMLNLGEENFKPTEADLEEAAEITQAHINNFPHELELITNPAHIPDSKDVFDKRSPMSYWPVKPEGGWGYFEGDHFSISNKLPVFIVGGWFDILTRGTLNNYQYGLSKHNDADKCLLIGDWYHIDGSFGIGIPAIELCSLPARWFDWKIKGKKDSFMTNFPVVIRVLGADRWRAEQSWPLSGERTMEKTLYLSKKKANPIKGDPFTNDPDNQIYLLTDNLDQSGFEKENPVMKHSSLPKALHGMYSRSFARWSLGAAAIFSQLSKSLLGINIDEDMYFEDERNDEWKIPTFTTAPLEEDVEIIGPLTLTFWARTEYSGSSSQKGIDNLMGLVRKTWSIETNFWLEQMEERDVQWVVELNDVYPKGRAKNITSGWLRASHRPYNPNEPSYHDVHPVDPDYTPFDPFYSMPDKHPKAINEGELYQYVVELWPTCNVFKKGHRIRVSISGSDFPHLLPILNPSTNTIVIEKEYPAKLDFKIADNSKGEGITWKWIGPGGTRLDSSINDFLLHENDFSEENEAEPDSASFEMTSAKDDVEISGSTVEKETEQNEDTYLTADTENSSAPKESTIDDTENEQFYSPIVKDDMDSEISTDAGNRSVKRSDGGCFISVL